MKRLTLFGMTLLGLVVAIPAFAQTNLTGDWEATLNTPQGPRSAKLTFKQDGDKLTGTIDGLVGLVPLQGTMTGSDLKFSWTVDAGGQIVTIKMVGKMEGSSIAGNATFGDLGDGTWTAKRVDAAATSVAPAPGASAFAAGDAAGKWAITLKTSGGVFPSSATLTQDGDKLSGTFTGPAGDVPVTGTSSGKSLTLSFKVDTPQGVLSLTLTGDVDGDTIANGKADFGAMGPGEWIATRAKP